MPTLSASALQPQSVTILTNGEGQAGRVTNAPEKKGFGFGDFLDMINPLHHIPVVGQVYRAVTGDTISDKARLAGGGLFAGPLGIGIAAGTIAMRKDGAATPQQESPQSPVKTVSVPINDGLSGYQKIASKHWTPGALAPLSASIQSSMGEELKSKDEKQAQEMDALRPAPVGDVTAAPLKASGPQQANAKHNAQVWAQMLSNLEKYEAMSAAPR